MTFAKCLHAFVALAFAAPAFADDGALGKAQTAFDFTLPGIDGKSLPLDQYRGKAILVANTASHCGYTHQYKGLQSLWDQYRDKGLVVIGAPSDDFNQEFNDKAQVREFCELNYGVDFPLTDIISVKGSEAHPFFAWTAAATRAPGWNFNKYLINAEGEVLQHYSQNVTPARMVRDIEAALPE